MENVPTFSGLSQSYKSAVTNQWCLPQRWLVVRNTLGTYQSWPISPSFMQSPPCRSPTVSLKRSPWWNFYPVLASDIFLLLANLSHCWGLPVTDNPWKSPPWYRYAGQKRHIPLMPRVHWISNNLGKKSLVGRIW